MRIYYFDGSSAVCDDELYKFVRAKTALPVLFYNDREYVLFEGILWTRQKTTA